LHKYSINQADGSCVYRRRSNSLKRAIIRRRIDVDGQRIDMVVMVHSQSIGVELSTFE
jgi:hypothetical protein